MRPIYKENYLVMAKIPFSIDYKPQIESGEYEVKTRFGEPVEIVKWDCRGEYPILACIFDGDTDDSAFFSNDGKGMSGSEDVLYIITPEPELTDWQKFISGCLQKHGLLDCSAADRIAKECSTELLELARKELAPTFGAEYMNGYEDGINYGRAEALKDLPGWKKATEKEQFNKRMIVLAGDNDLLCTNYAEKGEYYISFSELEKLPKED